MIRYLASLEEVISRTLMTIVGNYIVFILILVMLYGKQM